MSVFERITEHSPESDLSRGREAGEILSRDAFFDAIEEAELNFLEMSVYGETVEERELARTSIIALTEVVKMLRKIQSEGEYAEKVLENQSE